MFRLVAVGLLWDALVWGVCSAEDWGRHPLLASIVLLAALVVGAGTFLITFVAVLLAWRGEQRVEFGSGITYLILGLRIALTRRRPAEARPNKT